MIKCDAILEMRQFACHGVDGVVDWGWKRCWDADIVEGLKRHFACARDERWFGWDDGDIFFVVHVYRVRVENGCAVIVADLSNR